MIFLRYLFFILFSIFSLSLTAQEIEYKSDFGLRHPSLPDITILTRNVSFKHGDMTLYADSALYDDINNRFDAFKNILINVNDTLFIYGDILHYEGNTKIADIKGKVKLIDDSTVLRTNFLQYERIDGICMYPYWGHTTDSKNELYSKKGYYYTASKNFFFKDSVVLKNESSLIYCDTLQYNTITDIAYFFGPAHIYNKDNYIYTEKGWYNTQTEQTESTQNSYLKNKDQTLKGDSIYYEKNVKLGRAYGNVEISDSINNVILRGLYAETNGFTNYSFITGRATALFIDKNDTLFVHSDTIAAKSDTLQNFEHIYGFYKTKFYKEDLQGICDSIYYNVADSLMEMYRDPVIWTGENQFSADTVKIETGNEGIKKAYFYRNSFIISRSDTLEANQFDQLKGRNMIGYFTDSNDLEKVDINGNTEFIYYIREGLPDSTQALIGINVGVSSDMTIFFIDNTPSRIKAMTSPNMTTYPEEQLTGDNRYLKNFKWLMEKRPLSKEDIYKE